LKVCYEKGTEQTIGSKVVQVYRSTNSEGIPNGTWSCPKKNLSSIDAVAWKTCMKIGIGYWALEVIGITALEYLRVQCDAR
jgi:hypothetical protein